MDIESLIFEQALKKGKITTARIVRKTGFSHAYVHRIFQRLVDGGHLFKTGSTKNARYFLATDENIKKAKAKVTSYSRVFKNISGLEEHPEEHKELERLKKKIPFTGVSKNAGEIFDYAFTEILNNAIEHSETQKLNIKVELKHNILSFEIRDFGIGIFNNIAQRFGLNSHSEAITELHKGKLTTAKEGHSGEGIYFSSKAADTLIFQSSEKKLIYNTLLEDIFVRTIKNFKGTKVTFNINIESGRNLTDIFNMYTNSEYAFTISKVMIKLFSLEGKYISRSEARRVLSGMEKFKKIVLDFKGVQSIGQGFADEVFRVWKNAHPGIEIVTENAGDDVMFMIKRAN